MGITVSIQSIEKCFKENSSLLATNLFVDFNFISDSIYNFHFQKRTELDFWNLDKTKPRHIEGDIKESALLWMKQQIYTVKPTYFVGRWRWNRNTANRCLFLFLICYLAMISCHHNKNPWFCKFHWFHDVLTFACTHIWLHSTLNEIGW